MNVSWLLGGNRTNTRKPAPSNDEVWIQSFCFRSVEVKERILFCLPSHFYVRSCSNVVSGAADFPIFAERPWTRIYARLTGFYYIFIFQIGSYSVAMDDLAHTMKHWLALNLGSCSCLGLQHAALMCGLGFHFYITQFINTVHFRCITHSKSDDGHRNFHRFPFPTRWRKSDGILT